MHHLLLHCIVAFDLWSFILNAMDVIEKVLDLLCGWRNWVDKLSSDTLNLVLLYMAWTLWME